MENNNNVLEIRGLNSYFFTEKGVAPAVDGLDLDIPKGKIIGLVGESGCGHRNGIAFPDDHRQGTRPESTGQFAGSLRNFTCNTFHIGKVRNVHDQGVVRRTSFCCIDFAGSFRMQGISAKTVYRFCRKSDQFTLCDQTSGLFHNCFVNLFGIDTFYFCIHHIHTLLSALYPVYYSP